MADATSKKTPTPASKMVARKGITVGSTQGARSSTGSRFPESARKSAQASVRSAMKHKSR